MKCSIKRATHWEIWRTKRIPVLVSSAIIICVMLRQMKFPTEIKARRDSKRILEVLPEAEGQEQSEKSIVLLVANQRSGSTFVGEMFNQNPEVFYLFEPLFPYGKHCAHLQQERVELLDSILHCDFGTISKAYQNAFDVTKFSDEDAECMKNNLCFETSHRPLLKNYAKFCQSATGNQTNSKSIFDPELTSCGFPLKSQILSNMCKSSKILVYKVLRLCSLKDIETIYTKFVQNDVNFYIIHLVRDPRAVVASRINLKVDGVRLHNASTETELLCSRYERNVEYVEEQKAGAETNMITSGRYMHIRHEDITTKTYKIADDIYKFIGQKMPPEVQTFISKSHQSSERLLERIRREDDAAIRKNGEVKKYTRSKDILYHMNNPFGTVRDAKEVLSKWRLQLPYSVVELVQKKCEKVFDKLGYKVFNSKVDMVNLTKPFY